MFPFPLRRPTPLTIAAFVVVAVAVVRIRGCESDEGGRVASSELAEVARVIDGDTLDLQDGRRVRLLGIDAPEKAYQHQPGEPFADASTAWLTQRLQGKTVRIQVGDTATDRYGRTLAWVYERDAVLVNRDSLEAGMSRLLDAFGLPPELEPELRQAEATARIRKLGIWSKHKLR